LNFNKFPPKEVIKVKRKKTVKEKVIDHELNHKNSKKIKTMIDKSKTIDFMKNCLVDDIPLYNYESYEKFLEYKNKKASLHDEYIKIRIIIQFKLF
jgi:hypothetical protein